MSPISTGLHFPRSAGLVNLGGLHVLGDGGVAECETIRYFSNISRI